MNVNKVILVGRLTRDPEVRNTNSGQTVTNVGIATNSFWTDQNGQKQERTEFHNIVLFGRLGEVAGQYLVKGQEAYFEGRIQSRSYTGKDNVERRVTEIVAENMQFGSKPQGGGGNYNNNQSPQNNQFNQQNQSSQQSQSNQQTQQAQQGPTNQSAQSSQAAAKEEEIPTINLDDEQDEVKIEDVPF